MNLRTTITLLVLAVAGAAYWASATSLKPTASKGYTLDVLRNEIQLERLTRIELRRDPDHVVFERKPPGDWALPGNWPVRDKEVRALVERLTSLSSRFAPIPLGESTERYGLAESQRPLHLKFKAGEQAYDFVLGEEPGDSNRFSRPTFLRLGDQDEVIRLAPNLIAILDRPADFYQQRRLFPADVAKANGSTPMAESKPALAAKGLAVQGGESGNGYALAKKGSAWEIEKPVRDQADPEKVKSLLETMPDIWAEQFVEGKSPADCGLDKSARSIRVTLDNGNALALLIGKESQVKTRTVTRPAPMDTPPGMPRTPQQEVIHEPYCFAKLENNDQIFEIKADKLKEIFTPADTLRDARLARFRSEDVKRAEIHGFGQDIVLVKDKDQWKMQKPETGTAETSKVNELLDKLAGLQARDKDVLDGADAKSYGLDPPAGKIVIESAPAKEAAKTFAFDLGREEPAKKKLFVRVEGRERINSVEDGVIGLVRRPALAYRGRKVIDLLSTDLARIEVARGGEQFSFEQTNGQWRLAKPAPAAADGFKVNQLAGDLGRLEAVEFLGNVPEGELEGKYGLGKSAIKATLTPAKEEAAPTTVEIGKQRPDRPEFYARLGPAGAVFTVKKEIHDLVDQNALAFRPLELWQLSAADITEVAGEYNGQRSRLVKEGETWRLTEPFQAAVPKDTAAGLTNDLATLKIQRYESGGAKNLSAYGLDKPAGRLTIKTKGSGKDAKVEEHTVLIGKPAAGQAPFAKLPNDDGVFVLDERVATAASTKPLDMLDRELWSIEPQRIERIGFDNGRLTLTRDPTGWQAESSGARLSADRDAASATLNAVSKLRAERFADYGDKVDLAKYGLDHPAHQVGIELKSITGKPENRLVAIGKAVPNEGGACFAKVDGSPGIAVLAPSVIKELEQTHLDFVDRQLWKFDPAAVAGLVRHGSAELEVLKRNGTWQLTKPVSTAADGPSMESLFEELSSLKALRIAAYPAKDLRAYGLDKPQATVQLLIGGTDAKSLKPLKIGKAAGDANGDTFVAVEGSPAVGVIAGAMAQRLLVGPLGFRDREIARFIDADRVEMNRGPRHVVFTKIEGTWKMTKPLPAEAEQADLEEWVNALARLRAGELVADHAADLKPYGLDAPQADWRLWSGEKEVLHLLIGSKDKDDRVYARLAGRDLVFRLDPALSSRALGEYRSRSVWLPLDTSQVESIRYGYRDHAFTLRKVDGHWSITGHPETAPRSETVSAILDALARLRVDQYVADTGADFKLYGLDPPELALEISTGSDRRLIHIGRLEGGTKKYYARLPEPGRSDVFVISEADGRAIVQTPASLAGPRK